MVSYQTQMTQYNMAKRHPRQTLYYNRYLRLTDDRFFLPFP